MSDAETLTIDEAAERLGTNRTRLLRLLSRPEFAALVSHEERKTKTGKRKARVIASASLADLAVALSAKPERERIREGEQSEGERVPEGQAFTFSSAGPAAPALDQSLLIEELRARVAAQAEEVAFLRATLQREQESRSREQHLLAAEQQITARKMIEATETAEPEEVKKNRGGNGLGNRTEARLRMVIPNAR